MPRKRRSPRQHPVHTKHPRYKGAGYNRGNGAESIPEPMPESWIETYCEECGKPVWSDETTVVSLGLICHDICPTQTGSS